MKGALQSGNVGFSAEPLTRRPRRCCTPEWTYPASGSMCKLSPWGSKTQIRPRSDAVVLVDEAAEHVAVANVARADGQRVLGVGRRSREVEGTMRPPAVVVVGIRPKRPIEVPPTEDERPIQALGPDRRDDPFGVGIGIGSPDRGEDHPGALRADHRVKRSAELRVPIVDEEPDRG